MWEYRARIDRVVDADTLQMCIDVGFHGRQIERMRLLGVNAPELNTDAGRAARDFVTQWEFEAITTLDLPEEFKFWPFIVTTRKTDSFGRYLAVVRRADTNESLAEALIAAGHGVPA